jgi:Holliday junction DNA helicase RuvA
MVFVSILYWTEEKINRTRVQNLWTVNCWQWIYFSYFAPMIAYLKGAFVRKSPALVVVEVGGVGYDVQISLNTYSKIQNLESGVLLTHLLVREDAHILYGFFENAEKELFQHLISVSGIGAGTARVMLSYMKPDEISRAIVQGNSKLLEGIKGIGRKTAERLVLELRDKLAKQPLETTDVTFSSWKGNSLETDALNALIALGINRQAADAAVQKVLQREEGLEVEAVIKKALQSL